jgi:RNA polymerase sigma-70 factor (ECF subfamily)
VLFVLRRLRDARRDATTDDSDGALIERAQQGDLDAFNLLVDRYQRAVYNVSLRYLRSPELAEDVTQDAFLRAYRALDTFRNDQGHGFRAWLLRIASNRALDTLRAQQRRGSDSLDARMDEDDSGWEPEDVTETPLQFAERGELSAALEASLGQLPPEQRLAVILADVQGYSYEEVAEITGAAAGTVKSRIHRGRGRLRVLLVAEQARELSDNSGRQISDAERA